MSLFADFNRDFFNIYDEATKGNISPILGGLDFQTAYLQWLVSRSGRYCPEFVIDDKACIYGLRIYRELLLDDLETDKFVGFVPSGNQKYMNMFRRHGIKTVCLEREMGCKEFGFYEWLEAHYGVDLIATVPADQINGGSPASTASGPSRQMGLTDVMMQFANSGKRFLDIGCGKGGAMVIANQFNVGAVDGLEISPNLCDIACRNLDLLGLPGRIINQSASEFDGYGNYDILYMYDPFRGELFGKVMSRIEGCIGDKPVILIYANPYHHKDVIRSGKFSLVDTVDTDFFHRDVKIYSANGTVKSHE